MALLESPVEIGPAVEVDRGFSAARISLRPYEYANIQGRKLGSYRLSVRSGALSGVGITSGSMLFSMRWPQPEGMAVITSLEAFYIPTVVFATNQEISLGFVVYRGVTSSATGGTAINLTNANQANSNKCRTSMGPSLFSTGQIATTTILGGIVGAGDAGYRSYGSGYVNLINSTKGTSYNSWSVGGDIPFGFRWEADAFRGIHPIILSVNEAIMVQNQVGFPGTGAAVLTVNMAWTEMGIF